MPEATTKKEKRLYTGGSGIDFEVLDVPLSTRYWLARQIVYAGTSPRMKKLTGGKQKALVKAAQAVENQARWAWREFVDTLDAVGWEPARNDGKRRFLRNCPPVGINTNRAYHPCDFCLICPYCLGRRALNLFMGIERLVWGDFHPRAKPREDVDVIAFFMETPAASVRQYMLSDLTPYRLFTEMQTRIIATRRREFNCVKSLGGFTNFTVDWVESQKVQVPILRRGGVMVVAAGTKVSLPGDTVVERIDGENLTKKALAREMAKICRYPRGWMSLASPATVAAYLSWFKKMKMLTTFGALRGRSASHEES